MLFLSYQRSALSRATAYKRWKTEWDSATDIAELVSIGDSAIAIISRGGNVKKIQINGNHDPRVVTIGVRAVQLHEFFWMLDTLNLVGVVTPLPTAMDAEELRRGLASALHVDEKLSLVLRSDAHFGGWGGPPEDVFSSSPDMSEEMYYATDYIQCSVFNIHGKRVADGESYCHVDRPPHNYPRW